MPKPPMVTINKILAHTGFLAYQRCAAKGQPKKNQKAKVSYEGYTGIQETTRKLPVLNATEYALILNESYANAGQALPFSNISDLGAGTDWQDEVFLW